MCRRLAWDRGKGRSAVRRRLLPLAYRSQRGIAHDSAQSEYRDEMIGDMWRGWAFMQAFSFHGANVWLHEMGIAPFCRHEPALLDATYPANNSYGREIVRSTSRARFLLLSPYLAIIRTNVLYMVELFSNSLLRRTAFSGRLSWVFPYPHFLVPECIKNATRLHWRGEA